jgi:uncharacterized protein YneR
MGFYGFLEFFAKLSQSANSKTGLGSGFGRNVPGQETSYKNQVNSLN